MLTWMQLTGHVEFSSDFSSQIPIYFKESYRLTRLSKVPKSIGFPWNRVRPLGLRRQPAELLGSRKKRTETIVFLE